MYTKTTGIRISSLVLGLLLALGICSENGAFAQKPKDKGVVSDKNYTRVSGTLVAIKRSTVVVRTASGRHVTVRYFPRPVQGRNKVWYSTGIHVSASGSLDLLTPGTIVVVGGKFRWADFHTVKEPRLRVYPGHRPHKIELEGSIRTSSGSIRFVGKPGLRAQVSFGRENDPTGSIHFVGRVVRTNPLVVRHNNNGVKFVDKFVKKTFAGRFAVSGAKFRIVTKPKQTVIVILGKSLRFAGKEPNVQIRILNRTGVASTIHIRRKGLLKLADLKPPKSKKKKKKGSAKAVKKKKKKP